VEVPTFVSSSSQCDSAGNIFFGVTSPTYAVQVILRIAQDGKGTVPFPLPSGLGKSGEWHYSSDGNGGLYILYSEVENHVMIHLSPWGERLSTANLHLPRYFHTHSFAVLPDQRVMAFGSVPLSETVAVTNEKPISVWVDPSGNLVRQAKSGDEFSPEDPLDGLVTLAGTDSFIEAINSEVRVFSPEGRLVKAFPITKPTPNAFATVLQVQDGTIAIAYSHLANGTSSEEAAPTPKYGALLQTWLLLDATSGSVEGYYGMPTGFTGSALCYAGNYKFVNLTVKDGHPVFVSAGK
jgi:hypothetical protein